MSLYTTTRRVLGNCLMPIRTITNNTTRQIRIFKGIKSIKCNAFIRTRRQPVIRFRKGNYRHISQSSYFTNYPMAKPFPAMTHQLVEECRLNSGYIDPTEPYSGDPANDVANSGPIAEYWRYYAQAQDPDSPAPSKGGPVTSSGGRLGKLDAAHESGFFHKVNKSRLQQIKQMLKDKAMLRGADNQGKKE